MLRRLPALLCLLALLAPAGASVAGAALAGGLQASTCFDGCCADEGCASAGGRTCIAAEGACGDAGGEAPCGAGDTGSCGDEEGCPPGCPDCACSSRTRIATPASGTEAVAPAGARALPRGEPVARRCDADPREILHVPRG